MDSNKLTTWIQILTATSVLVGLGLVIWELQQVKTLARAQLTSDSTGTSNSIHAAVMGEDTSFALAKACTNPTELSLREALLLDSYYFANANLLARLALHSDRDGVYEEGYWRHQMWYLSPMLSSEYGREWLRDRRSGWPSGLYQAMQEEIEAAGPPWCESGFKERVERLGNPE